MLNFQDLAHDYNIPTADIGDKHYMEGWINTPCPFCSSSKNHLGYNLSFGYFNCWKCGGHNTFSTIRELLQLPNHKVVTILEEYDTVGKVDLSKVVKTKAEKCTLPLGTRELQQNHKNYLINRNFNPQQLIEDWGVKGTIGFGPYSNRIIIPIYYHGVLCSYQGRALSKTNPLRYKACKSAEEVVDHQDIVYGLDSAIRYNQCIVTEGVFDVWRLGSGSVCCFGIQFTNSQIQCLARHFKKVYVMFDNEYQAQRQADLLVAELVIRGVNAEKVIWDNERFKANDPGDMSDKDAKQLMKELGFKQ